MTNTVLPGMKKVPTNEEVDHRPLQFRIDDISPTTADETSTKMTNGDQVSTLTNGNSAIIGENNSVKRKLTNGNAEEVLPKYGNAEEVLPRSPQRNLSKSESKSEPKFDSSHEVGINKQ